MCRPTRSMFYCYWPTGLHAWMEPLLPCIRSNEPRLPIFDSWPSNQLLVAIGEPDAWS